MGIEFLARTPEHQQRLQELIQQMTASPDTVSEVLVEPEGIDWDAGRRFVAERLARN